MTGEEFLGCTSTHQRAHLVEHLLLGGNLSLLWEIPGCSECLTTRHDGNLDEWIGILAEPGNGCVASLMQCDASFLIGSHHLGLLLQSAYDSIYGIEEILLAYRLLVVAGSNEGSLVTYICNIGTREARSLTSQKIHVHCVIYLNRLEMNQEDGLTLVQTWEIYVDFSVETTCTEQGAVKHIHTVGSCQNDDATIGTETVHLGKQGVEGVFSLIVSAHCRVLAAGTAHCIDLIDEDDARSLLLCLAEEVADARCTHADEHLYEVRTAHGEERHSCLASHRLCQESLTSSWRTNEQCALRNFTTQVGIFLRILEKFYDFLYFLLGTFLSGNILESDSQGISLLVHLCLALTYIEDAAAHITHAASHSARHPVDEEEEEKERGNAHYEIPKVIALLVIVTEGTDLLLLHHFVGVAIYLVDRSELYLDVRVRAYALGTHLIDISRIFRVDIYLESTFRFVGYYAQHVSLVHILLEFGIGGFLGCASAQGITTATEKQSDEGDEDNGVEPIHVKPRHLRTFSSARIIEVVALFHCYCLFLFCVCSFFSLLMRCFSAPSFLMPFLMHL